MSATNASLVIGAAGLLGRSISQRLRGLGHPVVETTRSSTGGALPLDISGMAESWTPPEGVTTAYFCAAVTSQRECDTSFERCYDINVKATVVLVRRLVEAGIFVVFPSTNLVFDGSQPRVPADAPPCPRTAYGRMKMRAEKRLLAVPGGVGVVRLTKVVHDQLPIFAQWHGSLNRGQGLHAFHDMVFSPLPLRDAVSVLIAVGRNRVHGIVQASAQDDISYAEACRLLAKLRGLSEAEVRPLSWRESEQRFEHVPEHTTLDTSRAEQMCGFVPPTARAALEELFAAAAAARNAR